jgi:hypothetical protein
MPLIENINSGSYIIVYNADSNKYLQVGILHSADLALASAKQKLAELTALQLQSNQLEASPLEDHILCCSGLIFFARDQVRV